MAVTSNQPGTGNQTAGVAPEQRSASPSPSPSPSPQLGGGAAQAGRAGVKDVVLDFLERAGWTAGQVFFATLLAGGALVSVANLPWKYASVLALSAGVASIVLTALQYLGQRLAGKQITNFWVDMALRLAKTFLASLAGSFAAAHPFDIVTFQWTTALNLAAVAVLTALGKGLLARGSDTGAAAQATGTAQFRTASTLPTSDYLAVQQRLAPVTPAPAG